MKRNLMKMITVMLSLVLVIGLFAGCGKDGGTSAGPVKDDGSVVIRVPFASEPSSLDPGYGNSSDSICPRGMMFEGLVRIYDNKVHPGMAERWEVADDGVTYTFHLRDSSWSDGETCYST